MPKKSFEQQMEALKEIAVKLEDGGVSLAEALKLYGKAAETAKGMKDELELASGRVTIMRKELDGSFSEYEVTEDEL